MSYLKDFVQHALLAVISNKINVLSVHKIVTNVHYKDFVNNVKKGTKYSQANVSKLNAHQGIS